MNQTVKVCNASRVLEASFIVYGRRVDVCHTEVSKLREMVELQKPAAKKKVAIAPDPFNLTQAEQNPRDKGFFSEEDEVQLTEKKRREVAAASQGLDSSMVDPTIANFNFDQTMAPSTSTFNGVFRQDDSNVNKLRKMARDRSVLFTDNSSTLESIERDLRLGNDMANECFRKEFIKRVC